MAPARGFRSLNGAHRRRFRAFCHMPESLQPSLAQNCATLRLSGFRRLGGDDAEVNVDTGLRAAESYRPS